MSKTSIHLEFLQENNHQEPLGSPLTMYPTYLRFKMNHNNTLMSKSGTSLMVLYRESIKRISTTISSNFYNKS
jgi:hypothetical protein